MQNTAGVAVRRGLHADRLEYVRNEIAGGISLAEFHRRLEEGWPERLGDPVSYEAVRTYHFNRDAPAAYLARVAQVFDVRLEWLLLADQGKPTKKEEQERRRIEEELEAGPKATGTLSGELSPLESDLTGETLSEHETGVLLPSVSLLDLEDLVARHALFGAWRAITGGKGSADTWKAMEGAVLEPLHRLDLPTAPSEPFEDYVAAVALALRQYARAVRPDAAEEIPTEEEADDGEA